MLQEERNYREGLLRQVDSNASFAQLRSPQVHFENAEAARLRATFDALHTHHTPFLRGKRSTRPSRVQYCSTTELLRRPQMEKDDGDLYGDFSFSCRSFLARSAVLARAFSSSLLKTCISACASCVFPVARRAWARRKCVLGSDGSDFSATRKSSIASSLRSSRIKARPRSKRAAARPGQMSMAFSI